ncbi:hypothetical protein ACGFZL_06355 [Streptomyces sp. NPDC048182]|uniref:hypothetical protein n=1 Tax=Streptomyces sp. NPDC048182 TaxID=3365507 RepID=UPI00371D2C5A
MNIWQPDDEELLLARAPVVFATGAAAPVKGMRWFRDNERNEIQHELQELSGWPAGPRFEHRSHSEAALNKTLHGTVKVAFVAFMAALGAAGGNVSGGSGPYGGESSDIPDHPANEVDDFPVLWAAPEALARTLPWQLDPSRTDTKHSSTHLIVTDRRLVIVQLPLHKKDMELIEDEVLWQCPRTAVRDVARKNFKDGKDFTVAFSDGSWCRLYSQGRARLLRYLDPDLTLVAETALSPEQRATVSSFASEVPSPATIHPVVVRHKCGHYKVEILLPERLTSVFGASERSLVMDTHGEQVAPEELHTEDW